MTATVLPPAPAPADRAAREAIRSQLGTNLFVDASAGTGKTTELVERVVGLLRCGRAEPGQIAAITFTDAAAAELRHRVRSRLETCVAIPGEDPDGLLARALTKIDEAAITTLHAFAQRLLAEHPLEAGLPPRFEVRSEVDDAVAFARRWEVFLGTLLDDDGVAGELRRGLDLGLKLSALRDLAEEFAEASDRLPQPGPPPPLPQPRAQEILAALEQALALREACTAPQDKLLAHLETVAAPLRAALAGAATDAAVVQVLAEAPRLSSTVGAQAQWGGCKPAALSLLAQAQDALDAELGRQRDAVTSALAAPVAAFVAEETRARQRAGGLRYHDLLVLARDLLTDVPQVRRRLRRRYAAVLLDEFQDTDPLQIEIAVLLGSAHAAGRPWPDAEPEDGHLFVVGDPKQSIYRFRRADITVYQRAKRDLGMRHLTLTRNFRCAPGIAAWVNAAFGALFGDGEADAQPAYSPLVAEREAVSEQPSVRWFGGPSDERTQAVREREAADVAVAVRRILGEGWTVQDPVSGEPRRVRPRDIAILVRRHATVRVLERTLGDAGLPYRIESKSLVYASDEVRDLVTLLSAIDDPADEVAVVAALRHPALGCDDRALLAWRTAGGAWDPRGEPPPSLAAGGPVGPAMALLGELHARRWGFSPGGLVEHVIGALQLVELAATRSRPRDRWRRLRFVADQAHAFSAAGGHLRGFLRWVRRQEDADVRVDEYLVDEPDDDAVRITTIHGAKGLEYPIVVLLGLDGDTTRLPRNPRVLPAPDGTPSYSLGGKLQSTSWQEARDAETHLHGLEEVRLLYVGATRARDHLLVSLHHAVRARCPAAALLAIPALDEHWTPLALDVASAAPAAPGAAAVSPPPRPPGSAARTARTREEFDAWRAERRALTQRISRPTTLAATAIAEALAPDRQGPRAPGPPPSPAPADDSDGPVRRGRAATAFGRAVHATLQAVDLAADLDELDDLDDVARAQAAVEGVPGEAASVAAHARSARESEAVREALAAPRRWRELYVGAPVEGVTVEGFCDLVHRDGDGLVVVDYKTDRLAGRTPEEAVARYHPQIAAYALALESALGIPVRRGRFVLTATPRVAEVTVEGAAMETAKEAVRSYLRRL